MRGQQWLSVRRYLDTLVCLLSLPIVVPLAAIAMAAVWLNDRHLPLVRLTRVGRNGEDLHLVKIRSMTPNEGPGVTASGDDRITPVGAALRQWRLDEIPQIFEVVRGDMALIGPRPEAPEFVDLDDPIWQDVLSVRPAIAGMTQLIASPWEDSQLALVDPETAYRGIAVPAKTAIDRWYIENASPSLDIQIVAALFNRFLRSQTWTSIHDTVEREIPAASPLLGCQRVAS